LQATGPQSGIESSFFNFVHLYHNTGFWLRIKDLKKAISWQAMLLLLYYS